MTGPQLQLVRFPRMWIDLFDALNRMLPSVLPCRPWFWIYNQNRPRFRCFLKSSDEEPPTTIRTPSKGTWIDLFDALNPMPPSILPCRPGCGDTIKIGLNFAVF